MSFNGISSSYAIIFVIVFNIHPRSDFVNTIKEFGSINFFSSIGIIRSIAKRNNLKDKLRFLCFAPINRYWIQSDTRGLIIFFTQSSHLDFLTPSNHNFYNRVRKSLNVFYFNHLYDFLPIYLKLIHLKNPHKFFLLLSVSSHNFLDLEWLKIRDEEVKIILVLIILYELLILFEAFLLF